MMESAANQAESEIRQFTLDFLRAFEYLDMLAFIACFADDATAFFPAPEPPLRFVGKGAVQQQFERVFAAIRQHGNPEPPFHRPPPQDLLVQVLSAETALVSFHLLNAERTARRTLVLTKSDGAWRIRHLHASNGPSIQLPDK